MIAFPCSLLAGVLKYLEENEESNEHARRLLKNNAIWSGFTFLLGFLVVFRSSHSYNRFWDGCTALFQMRCQWLDACRSLCAFADYSDRSPEELHNFKSLLVRLFSLLHVMMLAEIEDCNSDDREHVVAFHYDVLDPSSIDAKSLLALKDSERKPELVLQWIQTLVIRNMKSGVLSVPPPILTRSFQELANGMLAGEEALKISNTPFPFPYAQMCEYLLIIHWLLSPFIVSLWVEHVATAIVFCFASVFTVWTLNLTSKELENPFGADANDLDCIAAQREMNQALALMIQPAALQVPELVLSGAADKVDRPAQSMLQAWSGLLQSAEKSVPLNDSDHFDKAGRSGSDDEVILIAASARRKGEAFRKHHQQSTLGLDSIETSVNFRLTKARADTLTDSLNDGASSTVPSLAVERREHSAEELVCDDRAQKDSGRAQHNSWQYGEVAPERSPNHNEFSRETSPTLIAECTVAPI